MKYSEQTIRAALEALKEIEETDVSTLADLPAEIGEIFWKEFRVIRAALEQEAFMRDIEIPGLDQTTHSD